MTNDSCRVMYVHRDECGNWVIKAKDERADKYYGYGRWGMGTIFMGYSKREAEREFRRAHGLQGVHFVRVGGV